MAVAGALSLVAGAHGGPDAMTADRLPVTVAIPTYRRERVLIETLEYLLALAPPPAEILVLDQTERHEAGTTDALRRLDEAGAIRWVRLPKPSIPKAMNQGLLLATQAVVLFLDDDIRPDPALLHRHIEASHRYPDALIAGRVIQPWHEGVTFAAKEPFHFACMEPQWVTEFMGGNFLVRRKTALDLGGFDENFVRVAYRFEAEFAHRFRKAGGRIWFEPAACIHHLKATDGGTRAHGQAFVTLTPNHAVGRYYFALRTMPWLRCLGELLWQPFRSVATRHHLKNPWWIPVTIVAEIRGVAWALRLWRQGPRYVSTPDQARKP